MNETLSDDLKLPVDEVSPAAPERSVPKELDWRLYRELADTNAVGVRKVGLLDEELAHAALQDERTLTVRTEVGDTPLIVPIEYAAGFDVERSRAIAENNTGDNAGEVYYFCLPPGIIETRDNRQAAADSLRALAGKESSIYFDYVEADQISKDELFGLLGDSGLVGEEIQLRDPKAKEGFQDITINFFKGVTSHSQTQEHPTASSIYEAYQAGVENGEFEKLPQNGPAILKAGDASPELMDSLWTVYQNRFEWLGENHPISMEESRDEFEALLNHSATTMCVNFANGEPICWTYFVSEPSAATWLQEDFIERNVEPDTSAIFFPGIVASTEHTGASKPTLQMVAQMMARTNQDYSMMFETTNVSEAYIPRLVKICFDSTRVLEITQPERIDNTHYGFMKLHPQPTEQVQP